jgi:hypothetical protein
LLASGKREAFGVRVALALLSDRTRSQRHLSRRTTIEAEDDSALNWGGRSEAEVLELQQLERQVMKLKIILALAGITAMLSWQTAAQTYDTNGAVVQTFAGSGFSGYVDGVGQLTMFDSPSLVAADSQSNLFVWEAGNRRIRKIAPDATVSTFAGGGGQVTGIGTNVNIGGGGSGVAGMTIDHNDTIWLVIYPGSSPYLYKITSGALVTVTNLPAFLFPSGICTDSHGNIYISDRNARKIYRYATNDVLTVFAGSGNSGQIDGNGIFTSFSWPSGLAADAADNIYVLDARLIRRIDQSQNVTTLTGSGSGSSVDGFGTNAAFASFLFVSQLCVDGSGNLIVACNQSIRRVSVTTNVTTIAGNFSANGYANGAGNLARFDNASGVCVSGGTVYVADSSNHRIRSITNNPTAQPVLPANLKLNTYPGLEIVGTVGRTYQIQSSPDMTNWTTRAALLLPSSPFLWIDQNPITGNKFYRAVLLP